MIAIPGNIFTIQSKSVCDIGLSTHNNKTFNNVLIKPMLSPDPYVITWTSVQRNVAMACGVGKTPEGRYEHAAEFVRMVVW